MAQFIKLGIGISTSLYQFIAGLGGGNEVSEELTDESANNLLDESGNDLFSSGA